MAEIDIGRSQRLRTPPKPLPTCRTRLYSCVLTPLRVISMNWLRSIWNWLADATHQKTLSFIGGGLVVIVGAVWQLYEHFSIPRPGRMPPPRMRNEEVLGEIAGEPGREAAHDADLRVAREPTASRTGARFGQRPAGDGIRR